MTGDDFRKRVDAEYMRHTGADDSHGSLSWFGRLVDRPPKRVWEWARAAEVPPGPHLRMLQVVQLQETGEPWVNSPEILEVAGKALGETKPPASHKG